VTQAWLLRGFVREAQHDDKGALAAWKQGALRRFVGPEPGAAERWWRSTIALQELVPQLIQAGLTDDLTPGEEEAIFANFTNLVRDDPALTRLAQVVTGPLSLPRMFRTMWQTKKGREVARQFVLREIDVAEAVRRPAVLGAYEVVRQQAFGGAMTEEQSEVVWRSLEDIYRVFREHFGRLGKKALIDEARNKPELVGLAVSVRLGGPPVGWNRATADLPPAVRGPAAYLLGQRYLHQARKDPASARLLFEAAVKDAQSEPGLQDLKRLAEAELEQLKKAK
jgi:hypothetical protein